MLMSKNNLNYNIDINTKTFAQLDLHKQIEEIYLKTKKKEYYQ